MPYTGADDLADAARRHAADARRLLGDARPDNAVHLAGFAAECALKHALASALGPAFDPKEHRHDVQRLAGRAMTWLTAVSDSPRLGRSVADLRDTALAHQHPDRRYWRTGWPQEEARGVVEHAEALIREFVLGPMLDHGPPFEVD